MYNLNKKESTKLMFERIIPLLNASIKIEVDKIIPSYVVPLFLTSEKMMFQ